MTGMQDRRQGSAQRPWEGALALKPEALIHTGTITGLDVSPDGTQIVFGSTVSGVSQLYLLPIAGGEPRQLTHATEASTTPKWSPTAPASRSARSSSRSR